VFVSPFLLTGGTAADGDFVRSISRNYSLLHEVPADLLFESASSNPGDRPVLFVPAESFGRSKLPPPTAQRSELQCSLFA
jgi:hypothetical protein